LRRKPGVERRERKRKGEEGEGRETRSTLKGKERAFDVLPSTSTHQKREKLHRQL